MNKAQQRAIENARKRKQGWIYNHANLVLQAKGGNEQARKLLSTCTCKQCEQFK